MNRQRLSQKTKFFKKRALNTKRGSVLFLKKTFQLIFSFINPKIISKILINSNALQKLNNKKRDDLFDSEKSVKIRKLIDKFTHHLVKLSTVE
jgi:hypothetical protein